MRKYVIMGVQGSGKGTQAGLLAADLDLVHISVGDIFRWHVQQHTKLGAQVRRIMASGELVGDDMAEAVTAERLSQHDWNYGFVIDGFPRNRPQAEFFLESYDIDGVIHLDLPDSEVRRRVLARRLCSGCGLDYNLITTRPAEEGTCDVCGGTLVAREDDTEEALAVRLRDYHEKTDPVLELFARKEYVVTVDARPGKEEVQQEIRDRLHLPPYKPPASGSALGPPCERSLSSAAAPTRNWRPRSAASWASRCSRSGCSASPMTAWRRSCSPTAGSGTSSSFSPSAHRSRSTWSSCCSCSTPRAAPRRPG
jgi:adenylate kinase